ncbi:MAG: lipid A deacylase LpxR family protein [Granulosicoccus sp.]|nr:lipid A deacylase LpxR family protein [Granulosicoccus sp.]
MRSTIFPIFPLILFLFSFSHDLLASAKNERWFSFSFDNDIFVGSDGGYTNGLYISWYDLPEDITSSTASLPWYYRLQALLTGADDRGESVFTQNIGQSMLTPADISQPVPDENDLPYAGLLFWQGSILFGRGEVTDFATLFLGIVGPLSFAEQSQKLVHSLTGSDEPQGWDFQLKNEPLVGVRYGRFWQSVHLDSAAIEYDIVTGAQGGLGNFISSVEADIYFRLGSKLETSYSLLALTSAREINPTAHSGGWFAYIGANIQYVFNNILFDGNTFRDSPSVPWEHWINSITAGFAFSKENWGLSFSYTDFGGINDEDERRQEFGSVTIVRRLQ